MFLALQHPPDMALPPAAYLVVRRQLYILLPSSHSRKLTNHTAYPGPSGQPQRQRILLGIVKAVKVP